MKKASRSLTVATMSILASSFSYAPAAPTAGQSIQFTDTSDGQPDGLALGLRGRPDEHRS
ncbi:MAG: hypothetical protein M0C28_27735 [Candidatus Moduliflexus flocculans]|nr:hypothetical protein [Candidatus Moduliflexus flocculans]